jgi:hypothetical protein
MKRLPTQAEVRDYLAANAHRTDDGRWSVPSLANENRTLFEPAALKIAEVCLILGVPLSDVITSDFALLLARRVATLEIAVANCAAAPQAETVTQAHARKGW